MSISLRSGGTLSLTAAKVIPVWIEHRGDEIRWHYKPIKPSKKTKEITPTPVWFAKADATWSDTGKTSPLCGGHWCNTGSFVADQGWAEIEIALHALAPDDAKKLADWNSGVIQTELEEAFELVDAKEID